MATLTRAMTTLGACEESETRDGGAEDALGSPGGRASGGGVAEERGVDEACVEGAPGEVGGAEARPPAAGAGGVVYLLVQVAGRRTYIGATVDVRRRVRQHNAEIAGGARRTRGAGPWTLVGYVSGFRTWREALQFEYAWRRVGRRVVRRYDSEGRRRALAELMRRERWSSRSPPSADVPLTLHAEPRFAEIFYV